MKCSQCHGAVDEQATACRLCGAALVLPIQCGHCRAVNRPSSQFCDQCGNLLEQDSDPRTDTLKYGPSGRRLKSSGWHFDWSAGTPIASVVRLPYDQVLPPVWWSPDLRKKRPGGPG